MKLLTEDRKTKSVVILGFESGEIFQNHFFGFNLYMYRILGAIHHSNRTSL